MFKMNRFSSKSFETDYINMGCFTIMRMKVTTSVPLCFYFINEYEPVEDIG